MAMKGLNLVEQHLEKGVLGLSVLLMLALAVRYLGMEPNKVQFDGQALGPGELDEAIHRRAETLQRVVANAKPSVTPVPAYAEQLRQRFESGILAAAPEGSPPLPQVLAAGPVFGPKLPALEEGVEAEDIALVTPLKPTALVVETGISLAHRQQLTLAPGGPGEQGAAPSAQDEGPTELSWVTVAGYFPLEAQQRDMTKAGYAGYRAKVYVVGLDVERQEMTASGEYGPWEPVPPSKATPRVELPTPAYDDKSGDWINQTEFDQKLELVRQSQSLLMQPPFYPVEAGDEWVVPPLPGHEPKEEAAVEENEPKPKPQREPKPSGEHKAQPPSPPTGRGGLTPPTGRGGLTPPTGRGGLTPPAGAFNPFGRPTTPQPGKDAKENLKAARKALREKNWAQAEQLAQSVLSNQDASRGDQGQAKQIVREARKRREQQEKREVAREPSYAVWKQTEWITNPEKEGEPAVWFHDDSVQPGKTYRYHMRVKLWNRYVGRRAALRDPTQADEPVLLGEWSLPSPPITVAPKRHFFVRGPSFGEPAASVDVFTWHKGNWLKEDFKVRVGDVIGGVVEVNTGEVDDKDKPKRDKVDFSTSAIVLDLRMDEPVMLRRAAGKAGEFAYRDTKSLVLVYLDPADGQVKERIADLDRSDPLYKRLKDEWESFKETLP
jgi:hypothetical protein